MNKASSIDLYCKNDVDVIPCILVDIESTTLLQKTTCIDNIINPDVSLIMNGCILTTTSATVDENNVVHLFMICIGSISEMTTGRKKFTIKAGSRVGVLTFIQPFDGYVARLPDGTIYPMIGKE